MEARAVRPRGAWNVIVALVGVLISMLLFVGLFAFHSVYLIPPPSSSGFPPSTDPEFVNYRNLIRTLGWISAAAMDLAVALAVAFAFLVGTSGAEVSDGTRRGLYIFATSFLVVWIVFSLTAFSLFRFSFV
jgi:hypothetical protein